MDLFAPTWWWVAAGVLVVAELNTGTFYLLMLALGLLAGAIAAHLGLSPSLQVITAAVVGSGATALWHWTRFLHPRSLPAGENKDVNLDVGETVTVLSWENDGTARVSYRGTEWRARRQAGTIHTAGAHRIVAVEGNALILAAQEHPL